jgi:CRP-like cAMP-binding protein
MEKFLEMLIESCIFTKLDITHILEHEELRPSMSSYEKDSIIHLAGEKCDVLEIIVKGEVLVQSIDTEGNILTINQLKVGEAMSANLLFSSEPYYPMSVFAKSDVVVLSFSKYQVLEFCNRKEFLENFLRCLADRTATLSGKIRILKQKSLRDQIVDFLIAQYAIQGRYKIVLPVTKKELANRFGVRRSSLSRELGKMRDDGLVDYDAKSITIVDRAII